MMHPSHPLNCWHTNYDGVVSLPRTITLNAEEEDLWHDINYFQLLFSLHFNYISQSAAVGSRQSATIGKHYACKWCTLSFYLDAVLHARCLASVAVSFVPMPVCTLRCTDIDKWLLMCLCPSLSMSVCVCTLAAICLAFMFAYVICLPCHRAVEIRFRLPFKRFKRPGPNRLFASINWHNQLIVTSALDLLPFLVLYALIPMCGTRQNAAAHTHITTTNRNVKWPNSAL